MSDVRPERSGWRDEAMSRRHREWGFDCPAVDVDFLMVEYDASTAVAMVEYKNGQSKLATTLNNPSIKAIEGVANAAKIPFLIVAYETDFRLWTVAPGNELAKVAIGAPGWQYWTELQYVEFLYKLRGLSLPPELRASLSDDTGF